MAKYYRQVTYMSNASPIYFLPPIIYKLEKAFMGVKFIYAEPYIDQAEWKRYSNNYDFCAKQSMATFSHFSWVYSQRLFMITDLQGSGCLLSDPAILSKDTDLFKE
jgi:hypothetical protein